MDVQITIIVGCLFLLGLMFVLVLKHKKRIDSYDKKVQELWKKIEVIQKDVAALCASGLGVDERVGGTEKRMRALFERIEELEENDGSEHLQEFQRAIKLAQEGATTEDIVDQCNLTRDEASLLLRLHQSS